MSHSIRNGFDAGREGGLLEEIPEDKTPKPDLAYLAQAAVEGQDYELARLVDLAREGEATDGQLRELAEIEAEFRDWEVGGQHE